MQDCRPGEVVIVPFPFTDRASTKRRPALVCSSLEFNLQTGHSVLAMITTASHSHWPDDVPIGDLAESGLPSASVVRWKLFTLDSALIIRRAGALSERDMARCREAQPVRI